MSSTALLVKATAIKLSEKYNLLLLNEAQTFLTLPKLLFFLHQWVKLELNSCRIEYLSVE
jgi:hypothetical protein